MFKNNFSWYNSFCFGLYRVPISLHSTGMYPSCAFTYHSSNSLHLLAIVISPCNYYVSHQKHWNVWNLSSLEFSSCLKKTDNLLHKLHFISNFDLLLYLDENGNSLKKQPSQILGVEKGSHIQEHKSPLHTEEVQWARSRLITNEREGHQILKKPTDRSIFSHIKLSLHHNHRGQKFPKESAPQQIWLEVRWVSGIILNSYCGNLYAWLTAIY